MPRDLSLPAEFLLLSHLNSGKVRNSRQAAFGCAAAELGELALRRKLRVRPRKFKALGFDVYRSHRAEIQLLDSSRTGLDWADRLLAELEDDHVGLYRWLRQHRAAFSVHRDALVARGLLSFDPGFRRGHHYPDPFARNALITELRTARGGPLDEHMLMLHDLVEAAELDGDLGLTWTFRQRLDRGRGQGAVAAVPEAMRDTSAALSALVPCRAD